MEFGETLIRPICAETLLSQIVTACIRFKRTAEDLLRLTDVQNGIAQDLR